jgi:hypothetical protein
MKVTKAKPNTTEPTIKLSATKAGDCVRFQHDTLEEAFKSDLFWMVIDAPEAKGRVRLVNLADGKQFERDGDHRVVLHECELVLN